MWKNRLSLQAGKSALSTFTCTEDTLIGNLWEFLGSPAGIQNIDFIVDGCDVGKVQVTGDFTAGSTFQFTCINDGRIIGFGGQGGNGGDNFDTTGERGGDGGAGQNALTGAAGFTINVDIDDGFLMGGGGGGGGGSFDRISSFAGDPGGGGGGGAGFATTQGGAAGSSSEVPAGIAGQNGGPSGPGFGGDGIGIGQAVDGGDGGQFGAGGEAGMSSDLLGASGGFFYRGGQGGKGGRAFVPSGATLNLNGSKSEATLRSEERLKGETTADAVILPFTFYNVASISGSSNHGFSFNNDGTLDRIVNAPGVQISNYWHSGGPSAGIGDDYEVRIRNKTSSQDQSGFWDFQPGAQGTWFALTSSRSWTFTSDSFSSVGALFEIRLASAPAFEHIEGVFLGTTDENGV